MTPTLLFGLTVAAALGCGLIGGVFFAFSSFVMKALARLPAQQGIAAMQSINIAVVNPVFLTAFLGSGVACLTLIVFALNNWTRPGVGFLLSGSLLYLVGTVLVTMVFHVPRNNILAAIGPEDTRGPAYWTTYVRVWTAGNHLRAIAALLAAGFLIAGLVTASGG